ncbi:hypothetical protein IV454_30290 [Massilia antarctica]|uniref:Bulb-type lectin domain-containing protein n=1 Tax=Massilia antarctica TaxID=2765360 RepID=A0AA48WBR3_9BURK|nr:hypothetical protein [Massilia antarctica]QPI49661.1 hypothetical protein IV454_30290 [Massilia antarctica]
MFIKVIKFLSPRSATWLCLIVLAGALLLFFSTAPARAADIDKGSTLSGGNSIKTGEYLSSPSGEFFLTTQSDGNFCVYHEFDGAYVWCTRSSAAPSGSYATYMQTDGNLCTYRTDGYVAWCLSNQARNDGPFYLVLQNDANVCIYKGIAGQSNNGTVWCSMATAHARVHAPVLRYGQIYHAQNGYNNWSGGYLDVRGANCEGNALCVSTAQSDNRDQGSGNWMIVSAGTKIAGSQVKPGDQVYVKSQYPLANDDMPPYRLFGGYLDARGVGCQGNMFCISASLTKNTGINSSIWTVEAPRHNVYSAQGIRLLNNFAPYGVSSYLDVRAAGCNGNVFCVSGSTTRDRDGGSGTWRFIESN